MGLAKELRNRRTLKAREVTVDAWADGDGNAFKMFCRPITCYDINELQKKHPAIMQTPTIGAMVDLILLKAEDEGGSKLFTSAEDRIDLMGEETTVISEIADQMFSTIESVETAAKN
jgi:hypothetical protein